MRTSSGRTATGGGTHRSSRVRSTEGTSRRAVRWHPGRGDYGPHGVRSRDRRRPIHDCSGADRVGVSSPVRAGVDSPVREMNPRSSDGASVSISVTVAPAESGRATTSLLTVGSIRSTSTAPSRARASVTPSTPPTMSSWPSSPRPRPGARLLHERSPASRPVRLRSAPGRPAPGSRPASARRFRHRRRAAGSCSRWTPKSSPWDTPVALPDRRDAEATTGRVPRSPGRWVEAVGGATFVGHSGG